jgi:hypothetical protein
MSGIKKIVNLKICVKKKQRSGKIFFIIFASYPLALKYALISAESASASSCDRKDKKCFFFHRISS